jgi:hypothetical protein
MQTLLNQVSVEPAFTQDFTLAKQHGDTRAKEARQLWITADIDDLYAGLAGA